MKYTVIAMFSALCLLASCSEKDGGDIFDVPQTGYTLFEADFEDVSLAGDKMAAVWSKDLAIGVFGSQAGINEKYTLKKAYDGKAAGEFYGPLVKGDMIMAYYPYSESYALYDGSLAYTLAPNQAYTAEKTFMRQFEDYAGYVYAFNDSDNRLRFRYASGLLSIRFAFEIPVTVLSLQLVSENEIAGQGKLNQDMSVEFGAGGVRTVKVDCGQGIISKTEQGFAEYPVVLPAGTYDDITLVVKVEGGNDIVNELDSFEIDRISVGDYDVTEVTIGTSGLGGFEIEGGLDFD